jgi:hypothetical protein
VAAACPDFTSKTKSRINQRFPKLKEAHLTAGNDFARSLFEWWGRNDLPGATKMLEEVRDKDLEGAVSGLISSAAINDAGKAKLDTVISTLKNARTVKAMQQAIEARSLLRDTMDPVNLPR